MLSSGYLVIVDVSIQNSPGVSWLTQTTLKQWSIVARPFGSYCFLNLLIEEKHFRVKGVIIKRRMEDNKHRSDSNFQVNTIDNSL